MELKSFWRRKKGDIEAFWTQRVLAHGLTVKVLMFLISLGMVWGDMILKAKCFKSYLALFLRCILEILKATSSLK